MSNMANIDKIKTLAKEQGLSLSYICEKKLGGLQRSYFNDVKIRGGDIPDERLKIIADTLNTTVEYLRDETEDKEKPLTEEDFTDEVKLLIELYEKATEEDKKVVMRMLESFAGQNEDK